MSLTFDTGLPKPQRTMLVEAIATRLLGQLTYLRAVKRIARIVRQAVGETHDFFGIDLMNNASQGNMPCVLVALGDAQYHATGTDPIDGVSELDVQLLVISSHLGGREDGRLSPDAVALAGTDPKADPGIDTMLEHIEERLSGQDLGVASIDVIRWKHTGEIDTLQEYSAWEARFTVQLDRNVNPDRAEMRQSLSIEVDNQLDGVPRTDPPGELDPIVTTITDLEAPTS